MAEINIGSVTLGDHDADWFRVACKLTGRSMRANAASVLGYYVRRRKKDYEEILAYVAAKHGLTPGECFDKLLNDQPLGEVVEGFAKNMPEFNPDPLADSEA